MWRQQLRRRGQCIPRAGTLGVCRRCFGNAPNRVRPVETLRECAWRQSGREVSAAVAIAVMFAVPVWLLVLSNSQEGQRRETVRAWAQRQQQRGDGGGGDRA